MAAASTVIESICIPKMNCALPRVPITELSNRVDLIIDNLESMKQLSIPNELSINVISIIVGSFVGELDFNNPTNQYPRNHEFPALVNNLLHTPDSQFSPIFLEHMRHNEVQTLNINQYLFLIDSMYSREEHSVPYGLSSVYSSVLYNPIISTNGVITNDKSLPTPIKYYSLLEPYIIPDNIDELHVNSIIEKFQNMKNDYLLINVMDCTSNVLRKLWVQNTSPSVYLAMPNCLAIDNSPMYKPVITAPLAESDTHEWTGCRWINWNCDKEMVSLYQLISPHTYQFLIHNYKRLVLETYFIPICKIFGRMRITLNYKLDDNKSIVFKTMCFQEFKYLWINKRAKFEPLFISFMDEYYKWNYYKFIDILLQTHSENEEPSMQKILLSYLEEHLKQLKAFFPSEPIPEYVENDRLIQSSIIDYLNANDIY